MKKALVVVDMQNDFITGSLANVEGQKIVPKIAEYIRDFDGDIIVTRDTHFSNNYSISQEGRRLPVPHCIAYTEGWKIVPEIQEELDKKNNVEYIDKYSFGSIQLGKLMESKFYAYVELVGVCTDMCVISNAIMIKTYSTETIISVHKDLCAGVTPESHENALKVMEGCQIDII